MTKKLKFTLFVAQHVYFLAKSNANSDMKIPS